MAQFDAKCKWENNFWLASLLPIGGTPDTANKIFILWSNFRVSFLQKRLKKTPNKLTFLQR